MDHRVAHWLVGQSSSSRPRGVCEEGHAGRRLAPISESTARYSPTSRKRAEAVPAARAASRSRLGLGEGLQGEAVADREEEADDRLGVVAEAEHALALLRLEDLGDVGAGAVEELADLALDVGVAAAGAEQLVEEQEEAGLVLDQVGEAGDEDVEDVVDGLRLVQRLVEAGDADLGVAADDLDQQPLLGAEVVVQEAAADARLARRPARRSSRRRRAWRRCRASRRRCAAPSRRSARALWWLPPSLQSSRPDGARVDRCR